MSKLTNLVLISLAEAVDSVVAGGWTKTISLTGEPGMGKTATLKTIAARASKMYADELDGQEYLPVYIYVPDKLDGSDFGCWIPNMTTGNMEYMSNATYYLNSGRPLCIMLDEMSKASETVQTLLNPLLTVPRRMSDIILHPKSMVLMAGNWESDGVGDHTKDHTVSRKTSLYLRKHTGEEWNVWAASNNIHPVVMAWSLKEPRLWESYLDTAPADLGPFVFNPKRPKAGANANLNRAYVCGRTLEMASDTLWSYTRGRITEHVMLAQLNGEIGSAGALDLAAMIHINVQIPFFRDIITDPMGCTVPEDGDACVMVILGAVNWLTKSMRGDVEFPQGNGVMTFHAVISAWMKYMQRIQIKEVIPLMLRSIRSNEPVLWAAFTSNPEYAEFAANNEHLGGI
jgi:hypothetical protein